VIVTEESEGAQTPLYIVHSKTLLPTDKPVTPVVGDVVDANTPVPEITVQLPVPMEGVFPVTV
jgi:hypothetical protein